MGTNRKYNSLSPEEIEARVVTLNDMKAELKDELKDYVVNKDYPLEGRWTAFVDSGLGDHDSSIVHFECLEKFGNTDRGRNVVEGAIFPEERHQLVSVELLLERLNDYKKYGFRRDEEVKITEADIDAFKEECLEQFLYSFDFDW